jgi:photosystem II stability/assembly factor-like uncharacterized protein
MKKIILILSVLIFSGANSFSQSGWIQQFAPTNNTLFAVYFVDTLTGWVAGDNGTILKTTNGGYLWFTQQSGVNTALHSICFTNSSSGWIVGDNGIILRTTNGGMNWTIKQSGTTNNLKSIAFPSYTTGWIAGERGTMIKYYYYSDIWAIQPSPVNSDLNSVCFTSVSTGWAVGNNGIIIKTTNSGYMWNITQNFGDTHNFYSVHFPTAMTGYVSGLYTDPSGYKLAYILKTPLGGEFWYFQLPGVTSILHSLSFVDQNKGIAIGDSGRIIGTVNGGDNWSGQNSHTLSNLYAVFSPSGNDSWAVGENGTVLKSINTGFNDTLNTSRRDLGVIPIVVNNSALLNAKYRVMFRAPDTSYNILRSLNNGASFDTIFSHISLSDTGKMFDGLILRVQKIRFDSSGYGYNVSYTGNVGVVKDPGRGIDTIQTRQYGWDYFPPQNRFVEGSKYCIDPIGKPWQSKSMSISFPTRYTYTGFTTRTNPAQLRKVKIVFTGYGSGQMAYRYVAVSFVYYEYRDWKPVPFKVYEIDYTDSTSYDRQLNCAFLEDSITFRPTGVWDPTPDSLGSKKVLYIFNSDYTPSPDTFYTNKNLMLGQRTMDVMYVWSAKLISQGMSYHINDEFIIYPYTVTRPDIVPGYPLYYEFSTQSLIGIEKISTRVPKVYSLSQNYPNPFNPSTKIKFEIAPLLRGVPVGRGVSVVLKVYDILGRVVSTLVKEQLKPGFYEVTWDASQYASGVYFYKLKAGDYSESKKMVLIK